jgi:hypothetical protein
MSACKTLAMAMAITAGFVDAQVPPDVCDRPEDCQRIFEVERRDEPWSSRLENELRQFMNARPELGVKIVECRKTLCSIVASMSGADIHPWAMAMIEMHAMPWYADFYGDSGTGSGPRQIEVSPGLWRPDPAGFIAIWWFLERKPAAAD